MFLQTVKDLSSFTKAYDKYQDFPGDSDSKASAYNAGNLGSIPGLGRSLGEGNGNPVQYSCLENSLDGGAQQASVHGVAKSQTRLNDFTFTMISININNRKTTSGIGIQQMFSNHIRVFKYSNFSNGCFRVTIFFPINRMNKNFKTV